MLPHVKCTSPARININYQIYMRCVCIYGHAHVANEEQGMSRRGAIGNGCRVPRLTVRETLSGAGVICYLVSVTESRINSSLLFVVAIMSLLIDRLY